MSKKNIVECNYPFIEIGLDRKSIEIDFESIFDMHGLNHLSRFDMSRKRNFASEIELFTSNIKILFEKCEDFLPLYFLAMKRNILKAEEESNEDFCIIEQIEEYFDDRVINAIDEYVEKTYTVNLDENTNKNSKNVNEELLVTDEHAKLIHKASMGMKLMTPILGEYFKVFNLGLNNEIYIRAHGRIFEKFEKNKINIYNKLFRLISSRVYQTKYSDRLIWSYLKNVSKDPRTAVRDIYFKLIVNVIPKLYNNSNVISLLHTVMKNSIRFKFTENYKISYKPINLNYTDSDGLTEFDKLEINLVRKDEGSFVLNKVMIREEIKSIMRELDIQISEKEFNYYKDNMCINKIQTNLLFLLFSERVGSYRGLYACSKDEYILLAIIARKFLKANGYDIIHKFMTANIVNYIDKRSLNKKKFISDLLDSKGYQDINNTKYRFAVNKLTDSGIIINLISTLDTNKFFHVPDYKGEYEKYHLDELDEINDKIDDIANELINFIYLI